MTEKRFIWYYVRQKEWWKNMDNRCTIYKHISEEILNQAHMITPKCRLDRMRMIYG